jgi:uncharacterized membrane protein YhaH (DUF805 family)
MSDWKYQKDGKESEAFSEIQLKELAEAGVITASTLVWRPDFPQWKPISDTDFQYKSSLQTADFTSPFGQTTTPQTATRPVEGLSLFDYYKRGLTKKYVGFQGRARRREYWGYQLFNILALLAVLCVGLMLDFAFGGFTIEPNSEAVPTFTVWLLVLFVLGTLLPSLAITVRRLHDIGITGWIYLVSIIPYIGGLIIFVMTVLNSQAGTNKYGPSPKETEGLDVAEVFS